MPTVLDPPNSGSKQPLRNACTPRWPPCGCHPCGSACASRYRPSKKPKPPTLSMRPAIFFRPASTKHSQFKAVTGIRNRALSYFKGISLPYPEPGIRLVRQHDIDAVHQQMETLQAELDEVVDELYEHFDELKSAARRRLGRLYNEADYPSSLPSSRPSQMRPPGSTNSKLAPPCAGSSNAHRPRH